MKQGITLESQDNPRPRIQARLLESFVLFILHEEIANVDIRGGRRAVVERDIKATG